MAVTCKGFFGAAEFTFGAANKDLVVTGNWASLAVTILGICRGSGGGGGCEGVWGGGGGGGGGRK